MEGLEEELEKFFDELGVTATKPALKKCVDLCEKYNITDGEEFVDTWVAYSLSKLHGENPTIEYLVKFERDELAKRSKSQLSQNDEQKSTLVIYKANKMDVDLNTTAEIMRVYEENVKARHDVGARTPENTKKAKSRTSPQATFSPASFSPTITSQSSKYASRTNSGEVVFPYTNNGFTATVDRTEAGIRIDRLTQVNIPRYMNYYLVDALDYFDEQIGRIGGFLLNKYELEEAMPVRYKHPSPFITFGRISCDSNGRLNAKSVVLEGSRDLSMGESIPLDVSGIEKFSVFPGQVVAVEGVNITGDKLMAKKIFCDASPESRPTSQPREPFKMVIASGPFTQSDSLTYQPLLDLMQSVSDDEPDVLILTGPFIESAHPMIVESTLAETHQSLLNTIIDQIMRPIRGKKTQVIMVSSHRDCNCLCVYPTPPIALNDRPHQNLHLVSDPCLVDVSGVLIGVTSTDSLMHIGKEEISSPGYSMDRLSRLAAHIISQRCFYPLTPPLAPVDPLFMDQAKLDVKPDILVLPSDLRYFIKDVSGCIVVNPERLAKGVIGGTYARLCLTSTGLEGNIIRI